MALHTMQNLTQAIQDAPLQELTNEEAEDLYQFWKSFFRSESYPDYEPKLPFHEWLTVNRVRIL